MHAESDSDTTRVGASTAFQPWAQASTRRPGGGPRAGGYWWHVVLRLGLVVVCSSLACAPNMVGFQEQSASRPPPMEEQQHRNRPDALLAPAMRAATCYGRWRLVSASCRR